MDFGKNEGRLSLDQAFWQLPLSKIPITFQAQAPLKIRVGLPVWAKVEFKGKIYPPTTKNSDFLRAYVEQYNAIELNSTFHALPSNETVLTWREVAKTYNTNFLFYPKFLKYITHEANFNLISPYLKVMGQLEESLGTFFLQLPPTFAPSEFTRLKRLVQSLPKEFSYALEVRHHDWFTTEAYNALYNLLQEQNITFITSDTSGQKTVLHTELSNPKLFVRFLGNGLHESDYKRLDLWLEFIQTKKNQLEEVIFFLHQAEEIKGFELSVYFLQKISALGFEIELLPKDYSLQKSKTDQLNFSF